MIFGCRASCEAYPTFIGLAFLGLIFATVDNRPACSAVAPSANAISGTLPAQVEVELGSTPGTSVKLLHEWANILTRGGISSVRASAESTSRPRIEELSTASGRTYRVYGTIDLRGDLILPGGRRFSQAQAAQAIAWFQELARLGPEESRPKVERFGLTTAELLTLRQQLALPLGVTTKDRSRREVLQEILQKVSVLVVDRVGVLAKVDSEEKVAEEVRELSTGTALAYLLRPIGLAIVPTKTDPRGGGESQVGVEIVLSTSATEIWPIGWPATKPPPNLVPQLYQFLEVNIQGVSAARVVEAVAERTQLPVLWDYNALARWGVEPAKIAVRFTPRSTTYAQLLRHCLFQAGLKYELRVDEAGNPFLWITTTKAIAP